MSDGPALLVDARNALYRAIYAVRADRKHKVKYHYFVVFLRQLTTWINKFRPSSVHVFWDAPKSKVWRRMILSTYKDRSNSAYVEDISEDLAITSQVAGDILQFMNVRQYARDRMEADDLIYAAVCVLHPQPSIIVSTDADMLQIPYVHTSARVWDPRKQEIIPTPTINPVCQKALMGDDSDAVKGYYGIGPKKAAAMLEDKEALRQFFEVKGNKTYYTNLALVDLSLCPWLLANRRHVLKVMCSPVCWNKQKVDELVQKYKVMGFVSEEEDLVPPFMSLT